MKINFTLTHLLIFLFVSAVYGDVHVSTGMDNGAVQAAVDAAHDGDTVYVPAGESTWTYRVAVSKAITLKGAGMDQTIIHDWTNASKYDGRYILMSVGSGPGNPVRVTGFTFDGSYNPDAGTPEAIYVSGRNWRIDHCKFLNLNAAIIAGGNDYGVNVGLIDHCTFYHHPEGGGRPAGTVLAGMWLRCGYGSDFDAARVWQEPLAPGTSNAMYVEDCYLDHYPYSSASMIHPGNGSRTVVRHNKVMGFGSVIEAYGATDFRGLSWLEFYENDINQNIKVTGAPWYCININGGTGVVFNNTILGDFATWTTPFNCHHYRSETSYYYPQYTQQSKYSCFCNGTCPLDNNSASETGSHTGSNDSNTLVCSGKNWAANRWAGYAVRNASDPGSTSLIISNTANSLTTARVLKLSTAGFTSQSCSVGTYCPRPGDIGRQVNIAGTGEIGSLLSASNYYNEKFRLWFVSGSGSIPSSGSVTLTGGTAYGDYVSVAYLGGGSRNHWDNGDNFIITNGYPCFDQVGRGPGPVGAQTAQPLYEWNNTVNGSDVDFHERSGGSYAMSYSTYVLEGRDFYNDTQRPGYVPYTYPHPYISYWGDIVDTSSPTTPGAVSDGTGTDASFTYSTTSLSANWTPSADADSGISGYRYAIGTAAGATNITGGWITNGTTNVTKTGLSLSIGTTYYFAVRAVNGVGLVGNATNSNGQVVIQINTGDTTPPINIGSVRDGTGSDTSYTYSTAQLSANWDASDDAESGLSRYWYATGTSPGATDIINWTDNGQLTSVTRTGLTLAVNTTYYFTVKAENGVGLQSAAANSNGMVVLPQDLTVPVFSNITAINITAAGATITWTTDEPSTSQVEYGRTISYGKLTTEDSNLTASHSVILTDLLPNSEYHYRVISIDANNNEAVGVDLTFATLSTLNEVAGSKVYPNPVNLSAGQQMTFKVNASSGGEVKIYTMSGKLVRKLPAQGWSALGGIGEITWDGKNNDGEKVSIGVYIYRITETNGDSITGKLAVMH